MRLPRRTPFYAPAAEELAYVHALLYGDRSDLRALEGALGVVRLWMNRMACPQAVESTALLMQAVCVDCAAVSREGARAAYAMAIVRFVNSVVDSFQTGLYAQSIGAIAERIGLPQWLVQVRHSATHEELPSLAVCRETCDLALRWLDDHYWRPALGTADAGVAASDDDAEPRRTAAAYAAQLLHTYRAAALSVARDRSLAQRSSAPHERAICEIERWVVDEVARRAALDRGGEASVLLGREAAHGGDDEGSGGDAREAPDTAAVLMLLTTQLLLPGALVPQAKERRMDARGDVTSLGTVAPEHAALWDPLMLRLHKLSPCFLPVLADALARTAAAADGVRSDFATYAVAWLARLALDAPYVMLSVPSTVARWDDVAPPTQLAPEDVDAAPASEPAVPSVSLPRMVLQYALEAAGAGTGKSVLLLTLAEALAAEDAALAARVLPLVALRRQTRTQRGANAESSAAWLATMEARRASLAPKAMPMAEAPTEAVADEALPPGWTPAAAWAPTPIGCLDGMRPDLLLV